MKTYNVDVIHEATGRYMTFKYESDAPNEDALCNEILSDLSVVAFVLEE